MKFDWNSVFSAVLFYAGGVALLLSVKREQEPAIIKRKRILWERESAAHGADLDRVQVWDAFSEMFLDSWRNEAELQWLAEIIADSPFSYDEIRHILFIEVGPVCAPNLCSDSGEWALFHPDWLIGECMERAKKFPFVQGKTVGLFMEWNPLYMEASLLLERVKRLRLAMPPVRG